MKMNKVMTTAMIFGIICLGTGLATATEKSAQGPVPFATWDADGNGTVDEQEFTAIREQRQAAVKSSGRMGMNMTSAPSFADIDTNGDGLLTAEEFTYMQQDRQSLHQGKGQGKHRKGQMNNCSSMGGKHHGAGKAMSGEMGQRYQDMDAETREKHDAFRAATADLRKEMAAKRAEKQAVMHAVNPDPEQAAQLTREMLELRGQLMAQAEEAGIKMGQGSGCGNKKGQGARW
jgi:hypothetical protein